MVNKRLGRPPLPSDETRSQRVVTFVTQKEMAQLHRLAKSQKLPLSATVHQIISNELQK
jgi:peptidase E